MTRAPWGLVAQRRSWLPQILSGVVAPLTGRASSSATHATRASAACRAASLNETVVLQRLDATGLTANLWYDIDTGTVFSPFLGGGAGAVFQFANEAEWPVSQGSAGLENYEFLWATGFGITYHLGAGIGVEVGAGVDARFS